MNKKGFSIDIPIILTIILVLMVTVAIFFLVRNLISLERGEEMEILSSELKVSIPNKDISIKEDIETSDPEVTKNASRATNFFKYCLGITLVLFVIWIIIKESHKFYLDYRKKRK